MSTAWSLESLGRLPASAYAAFVRFAGAVDAREAGVVVLERKAR